jgi:hypothetical protein
LRDIFPLPGDFFMPFARKVLWIVDFDANPNLFYGYAKDSGCDTVCVRTKSKTLEAAIPAFVGMGKSVWAWRHTCVQPDPAESFGPHSYSPDEAAFVADHLIPAGLTGYISDPESENDKGLNDWNQEWVLVPDPKDPTKKIAVALSDMATAFCKTIKYAAKGKPFHMGITSGCTSPSQGGLPLLPWKAFSTACDAVYPQCYWRWHRTDNDVEPLNGGTPDSAIKLAIPPWKAIAQGKPVIPMAGEVNLVTEDEIKDFGKALTAMNVTEAHFYVDEPPVDSKVLAAIKALQ